MESMPFILGNFCAAASALIPNRWPLFIFETVQKLQYWKK